VKVLIESSEQVNATKLGRFVTTAKVRDAFEVELGRRCCFVALFNARGKSCCDDDDYGKSVLVGQRKDSCMIARGRQVRGAKSEEVMFELAVALVAPATFLLSEMVESPKNFSRVRTNTPGGTSCPMGLLGGQAARR
jgi:hypothetical protein